MAEIEQRKFGGLTVQIKRDLCIGSGNCAKVAPEIFRLDDHRIATFTENPPTIEPERLIESCRVCPVAALIVFDTSGRRIAP